MDLQFFHTGARELFPFLQEVRRDLHHHPELAYQEVRTAGIVARELTNLGLEVTTGVAKTGVVALLEGDHPGPVILLRVDMDALPIQEEPGKEYGSENPGMMHACGHDGHVAIGLGTARLLAGIRSQLHGSVKFVFQPAEEAMNGAEAMIEDQVLANPVPDRCLAVHVWSSHPVGWVSITPGPTMAGADFFSARITGKGVHGATPHLGVDPVWAAAQIVTAAKGLVQANISSLQAAVLTVTSIKAGETYNVIPPYADLRGTIRTFTPLSRKILIESFERLLKNIAAANGCTVEWEFLSPSPPVTNNLEVTHQLELVARSMIPDLKIDTSYQTMVSEDMALMLEKIPGCYFIVGAANVEKGFNYPHHHPRFDIDEEALPIAVAIMSAGAASFLSGQSSP